MDLYLYFCTALHSGAQTDRICQYEAREVSGLSPAELRRLNYKMLN